MIKNPQLARKYARGLFEAVGDKADLSVFDLSPSVLRALTAPSISYERLIKLVGEPKMPELKNLLRLVCRRKRHALLPDIVELYTRIAEEELGVQRAKVTTATPIDRTVQDKIFDVVKKLSGARSVKLHLEQDPALIGGVVIRIGDNLIDGSVQTRLEEFRQRF